MKGRLKRLVGSVMIAFSGGFLGLSVIQSLESSILGFLMLILTINFSIPSKEDRAWKFWERKSDDESDGVFHVS